MEKSNYEKMKNSMAEVFLQYDQELIIRKFNLDRDSAYLYLCFVGRNYRIDRTDGRISWSEDSFQTERAAAYNEVMTIYDVLCNSREGVHLAHTWVNIGSLSSVQGGTLAKAGNFFGDSGNWFDGRDQALARACERLQGRKRDRGDVAYELDLFSFLPVGLQFWESDEEFPASLQILADKNILDYMHYETLMFAVTHLLNRIKEIMEEETQG